MQTSTAETTRTPFDATYVALTLTALMWSSNFVIGRAVHETVTPATMNFLRWAIALLGLIGIAAFQTLCYVALAQTTALNTILLLSLAPLAIVALSWLALGERISRRQAAGMILSLGGAVVLILHGDAAALVGLRFNAGDLWMLLAVGLWAIYSVVLKGRPAEVPPLALHTSSVAAGTLRMLPLYAWDAALGNGLPTAPAAWAAIGFVAVFSSAIAHALWVRGVASIGPNRAGVFIHLMPLFGAVLAITFLGEALAAYHVVGAALVLGGVALTSRR